MLHYSINDALFNDATSSNTLIVALYDDASEHLIPFNHIKIQSLPSNDSSSSTGSASSASTDAAQTSSTTTTSASAAVATATVLQILKVPVSSSIHQPLTKTVSDLSHIISTHAKQFNHVHVYALSARSDGYTFAVARLVMNALYHMPSNINNNDNVTLFVFEALVPTTLHALISCIHVYGKDIFIDDTISILESKAIPCPSDISSPKRIMLLRNAFLITLEGLAKSIRLSSQFSASLFAEFEKNPDALCAVVKTNAFGSSNFDVANGLVEKILQFVCDDLIISNGTKLSDPRKSNFIERCIKIASIDTLLPLTEDSIALATMKEAELSRALGYCTGSTLSRLIKCFKAYRFSIKMPTDSVHLLPRMFRVVQQHLEFPYVITSIGHSKDGPIQVSGSLIHRVMSNYVMVERISNPELPITPQRYSIRVPGSKSISNRALLLAGLAIGECRVEGLLHSDDTQVMMKAMQLLGANFSWEDEFGRVLLVRGNGGKLSVPTDELYMSNAGTASRFLISTCTLFPDINVSVKLNGNSRMLVRPQGPLVEALRKNGCKIDYLGKEGHLPILVHGGGLQGGLFPIEGKISSQYVSSVLLAAPFAKESVELVLAESNPTSITYIEMTIEIMKQFGIKIERRAINRFFIPNGQNYIAPEGGSYLVESDASSATYPLAIAAVSAISNPCTVTVDGVGSNSLQGDAKFCDLLRDMGCTISQTLTTTTVSPPESSVGIKSLDVNMADLTDAFMTAAVIAVFGKGTTRISGIANQHQKECDRIDAMCTEFAKLGIVARNLPDGIEIDGIVDESGKISSDFKQPPTPVLIDCYDDHRIAMSFAVLSMNIKNIVITDKDCTDKTYPEFWDHMETFLGAKVHASYLNPYYAEFPGQINLHAAHESSKKDKSIVLIGMRGAGKTTLGKIAAAELNWPIIDLDDALETSEGMKCAEIVAAHGWDGFRTKELAIFKEILRANPLRCVISCGGGIVESQGARDALSKYSPVISIQRTFEDIVAYLDSQAAPSPLLATAAGSASENEPEGTDRRPKYGEPIENVWNRRKVWYDACSSHDFYILPGESNWNRLNDDFSRFIRFIQEQPTPSVLYPNYFATEIAGDSFNTIFSSQQPIHHSTQQQRSNSSEKSLYPDAFLFRADCIENTKRDEIARCFAAIRQQSPLPIIASVRDLVGDSKVQDRAVDILMSCLRNNCEYVEIPSSWSREAKLKIINSLGNTRVIFTMTSYSALDDIVFADKLLLDTELYLLNKSKSTKTVTCGISLFISDDAAGGIKIIKGRSQSNLIGRARNASNYLEQRNIADLTSISVLCICQGSGPGSHAYNTLTGLTFVGSANIEEIGEDGSGAISSALQVASALGIEGEEHYYLFGSPIQMSPSPTLHNTGFQALGLKKRYQICDSPTISKMEAVLRSASFAGASVTIPHKENVMQFMNELSPAAKEIGAVNTVVKLANGKLFGDNTDWIGIRKLLEKRLGLASSDDDDDINDNEDEFADEYADDGEEVDGSSGKNKHERSLSGKEPGKKAKGSNNDLIALVIGAGGTSLAACYCIKQLGMRLVVWNRSHNKAEAVANKFGGVAIAELDESILPRVDVIIGTIPASSKYTAPEYLLKSKPLVFDVAYRPRRTALLQQAEDAGCDTIEGIEMLIEQGLQQFKIWTKVPTSIIPREYMEKAVFIFYNSLP